MLFLCNNCYFIAWLAALVDIMKQILCSDWLSERARLAHLALSRSTALILRKKKERTLLDNVGDEVAKSGRRLIEHINDSGGCNVLQTQLV